MANLKYIDIHSHLNFPKFGKDLSEVLSRMEENEVGTISVGVDRETSKEVVDLAGQRGNIWACIGVHPTHSEGGFDEDFFEELAKDKKVVCIGECGLDYFNLKEVEIEKQAQKKLFKSQIEFALKLNLPLMLHVRPSKNTNDAHQDTLEILESYSKIHGSKLRGNSHFFVSSLEIAERYIDMGFSISFTGLITYVWDFNEVIKKVPVEMIHAETDAPYVAPVPYRGGRSEPLYVIEVVKKIAELREVSEKEIRQKLLENANKLFGLKT